MKIAYVEFDVPIPAGSDVTTLGSRRRAFSASDTLEIRFDGAFYALSTSAYSYRVPVSRVVFDVPAEPEALEKRVPGRPRKAA